MIPRPFPKKRVAYRLVTLDVPYTLSVLAPKITAVFAKRLPTFIVSIFAVPKTYKFEPAGGSFKVPIDTPFEVAILK